MTIASELLTPTEAAVVSEVSVRDVNRVFDEHILPASFFEVKGRRWVKSDACAYVRFYFHTASRLTAPERARVIHQLITPPDHDPGASRIVKDDFLVVNFSRFVEETHSRHDALRRARELVTEDSAILGGAPIIRGTRIPVYDVAASVKAGRSKDEIRAAYSRLTDEQIDLANLYASANPPRGRPSKVEREDMELVTETRTPRRPRG
jgi:uncharacterized protein (DUF433 family)